MLLFPLSNARSLTPSIPTQSASQPSHVEDVWTVCHVGTSVYASCMPSWHDRQQTWRHFADFHTHNRGSFHIEGRQYCLFVCFFLADFLANFYLLSFDQVIIAFRLVWWTRTNVWRFKRVRLCSVIHCVYPFNTPKICDVCKTYGIATPFSLFPFFASFGWERNSCWGISTCLVDLAFGEGRAGGGGREGNVRDWKKGEH